MRGVGYARAEVLCKLVDDVFEFLDLGHDSFVTIFIFDDYSQSQGEPVFSAMGNRSRENCSCSIIPTFNITKCKS